MEKYDDVALDDCPICREMREEFGMLDDVPLDYLAQRGMQFRSPEELNDQELHVELWSMVEALASIRIFLESTDHLSDRELYEKLWSDILRKPMIFAPDYADGATHIPLLDDCDDDTWLRYYADDEDRKLMAEKGQQLPPRTPVPFPRDAMLPSRWGTATPEN